MTDVDGLKCVHYGDIYKNYTDRKVASSNIINAIDINFREHRILRHLIHISQAERGLKCGLFCPACRKPLIARKGKLTQHHFAHYKSAECKYAQETAVHLLAKEAIAESGEIFVPELTICKEAWNERSYIISEKQTYKIDSVEVESRIGSIRPDLTVFIKGHPLLIEICVTHKVDSEKLSKIKEINISAIEIDLSDIDQSITKDLLLQYIHEGTMTKWLYNRKEAFFLQQTPFTFCNSRW
jgi:hypothetical protein